MTIANFPVTFDKHVANPQEINQIPCIHIDWKNRVIAVGYTERYATSFYVRNGHALEVPRPNIRTRKAATEWLKSVEALIGTVADAYQTGLSWDGGNVIATFIGAEAEHNEISVQAEIWNEQASCL